MCLEAGIQTAGVQDAVRIEMRLEPAMEEEQRLGQWMERAGRLVGGAKERRVTAVGAPLQITTSGARVDVSLAELDEAYHESIRSIMSQSISN